MRIATGIVVLTLLVGCESFEPVGTYTGDANLGAQIRRNVTRTDEQGHSTVTSSSSTQSRSGVSVTVRRAGERRLELILDDGCVIPLEQDMEPNEHNTTVAWDGDARCPVTVEGYSGPIHIGGGTATFDRENRTITVHVNGAPPRAEDFDAPGAVNGSWSYSFDGTRPE